MMVGIYYFSIQKKKIISAFLIAYPDDDQLGYLGEEEGCLTNLSSANISTECSSRNIDKLCSELKLVADTFLFIYAGDY